MKLSAVPVQELSTLSVEQITRIVFPPFTEAHESAAAALVLGGNPRVLSERAQAAAELYHRGLVSCLIPTGGVQWDTERGRMSEAEYLSAQLAGYQVPAEAILLENQAKTTRENMLFATILLERHLHPRGAYNLYVVSSPAHIRRSLVLAQMYLPRIAHILGYTPKCSPGSASQWHKDAFRADRVRRELGLIKKMVDNGEMEDIDF